MGKVAEIVESESLLKIGLSGTYLGHRFELTGRAQLKHELGGFWDEWYATFSNGWVGWLAEAQGKIYLTFYQPLPENVQVPAFENLQLGQTVPEISNKTAFIVTEKGTATSVAAEGEIPYQLTPNEQSNYADLSGQDKAFGTIDYSTTPPFVFVGQEVTLADIGLNDAKSAERKARRVTVGAMGCPNCGGSLQLNAPDKTERVTCPFCNSLLDVNQGNLKFLRALSPSPSPHEFVLQIGAKGTFEGDAKLKIIGAVVRSVSIEGESYFWDEYLLYNPNIGFRWLVHSDNHWNFVEPINAAEVSVNGKTVSYNSKSFKIFQDAHAKVEHVKGEFYWRVEQGETVRAIDFVAAPLMLSQEISNNEINWSAGNYLTNTEVEKAFNVSGLPKPFSVAPNQPFTGGFYIKYGLLMLGILLVAGILMIPVAGLTSTVLSQQVTLLPTANSNTAQTAFSQSFEIKGRRNVRITANAPVNNSWANLDVDLVNEQNNEVESVPIDIEYYTGADSDGSWAEGGQTTDATVSALPAGKYTLRVEGTWENSTQPLPVSVKVEQNVNRGVNFFLAFIVLSLFPIFGGIRKLMFESKRWSESMFQTGSEEQ